MLAAVYVSHQRALIDVCSFVWLVGIIVSILTKKEVKKRIIMEKMIESRKNDSYYIAVDIGKRNCVVCITDKDGSIIEEINLIIIYRKQKDLLLIWIKNMIVKDVLQFVNQQQICGSRHMKHLRKTE